MSTRSDALINYLISLGHTYLNSDQWSASMIEYGKFTRTSLPYIKIEIIPKLHTLTTPMIKVSVMIEKDYNDFVSKHPI